MLVDSLLSMYHSPILESHHTFKKLKAIWSILFAKRFLVTTIDKTDQETRYNIICKRTNSDDLNQLAHHFYQTTYFREQEYTLIDFYNLLDDETDY